MSEWQPPTHFVVDHLEAREEGDDFYICITYTDLEQALAEIRFGALHGARMAIYPTRTPQDPEETYAEFVQRVSAPLD